MAAQNFCSPSCRVTLAVLAILFSTGLGRNAAGQDSTKVENGRQIIVRAVLLNIDEAKLSRVSIPWEGETSEGKTGPAGARTAVVDAEQIKPLLANFKERGARILSEPTLMTLDGQQATVQTGGAVLLPIGRIGDLAESPDRLNSLTYGTTLTATPSRISAERVLLELCVENSVLVGGEKEAKERRLPIVAARKLATAVVLRPRQAVLLSIPELAEARGKSGEKGTFVACLSVECVAPEVADAAPAPSELDQLREELRELRVIVSQLAKQSAVPADPSPAPALPRPRIERAVAAEPIEASESAREKLSTKVYNVADLVIPIPDALPQGANLLGTGRPAAEEWLRRPQAEEILAEPTVKSPAKPRATMSQFAPLIGLIVANVSPDSWKQNGGNCVIQSFETNLSLVILQTEEGHAKIAKLLEKLRWLQDHTMMLQIEVVSATDEACERAHLAVSAEGRTLSPQRASHVREALLGGQETKIDTAPRVTLFNKQLCEVSTTLSKGREFRLLVHGALEDDLETVRLNLAVNALDAADTIRSSQTAIVFSGETLVLDVTSRVGAPSNQRGVPILDKIPHVEKLFKNVSQVPDTRTLLFVTPRVHSESATAAE